MGLRNWIALTTAVLAAACGSGGKSPTAPTTTVVQQPATTPTTTAPPTTPAPTVPATPYTGRWSGRYTIDRCDGTGSVQDLFCGTRRGIYPPGTSLPLTLDLTQVGASVSGTLSLGSVTGVVTGAVRSTGLLTLSGVARGGTSTATITYWDTRASGNSMNGYFNFNATYVDIPGIAAISATIGTLTK